MGKIFFRYAVATLCFAICLFFAGCFHHPESQILTEQQAQQIIDVIEAGVAKWNELRTEHTDALERTAEWLRSQNPVEDSGVSSDGTIWILYKCGMEGFIFTNDTMVLGHSEAALGSGIEHPVSNKSLLTASPPITPTVKKAVILLPLPNAFSDSASERIRAALQSIGYTVEVFRGEQVTVDLMARLSQYGVIYIKTHGGQGLASVSIVTGEKVTVRKLISYWWPGSGIGIGAIPSDPGTDYFTIDPRFVARYTYPRSVVVINACSSFSSAFLTGSSFVEAFLNSGAAAYFGWTNPIFGPLSDPIVAKLFEQLVQRNVSVETAYNTPIFNVQDTDRPGTYSINDLFPLRLFKDENKNSRRNYCYQNAGCHWEDPGENTPDYEVDFKYKAAGEVFLNLQQPANWSNRWDGILIQTRRSGPCADPFRYSLFLTQEPESDQSQGPTNLSGISRIEEYDAPEYFGVMTLTGTVVDNRVEFQENTITDENRRPNWRWCLKHVVLELEQGPNEVTFKGTWEEQPCCGGLVVLAPRPSTLDVGGSYTGILHQSRTNLGSASQDFSFIMDIAQDGTKVSGLTKIQRLDDPTCYAVMSFRGEVIGQYMWFQETVVTMTSGSCPNPEAWCMKSGLLRLDSSALSGEWWGPLGCGGSIQLTKQ